MQREEDDIYYQCRQCQRPFGWWDQLGMRTCRIHPGELRMDERRGPCWTCCGLAVHGRGEPGLQPADSIGCTPCDHLCPDEEAGVPVFVAVGPHSRKKGATPKKTPEHIFEGSLFAPPRIEWLAYHGCDVWNNLPLEKQREVMATVYSKGSVPLDLQRVHSWLPREAVQLANSQGPPAAPDPKDPYRPVEYYSREALAAGLGLTTPPSEERQARAERAEAMREHAIKVPLAVVTRCEEAPLPGALARIRRVMKQGVV